MQVGALKVSQTVGVVYVSGVMLSVLDSVRVRVVAPEIIPLSLVVLIVGFLPSNDVKGI